jgi:F0F1-type ATP synthase membrane subunit c/vacuolar-type H+-ATPase subunit K
MLNSKNIAMVAKVAIVLALGTAGIVTAIGQGAHAQATCEKGKCRGEIGKHGACVRTESKLPFCAAP